MTSKVCFCAALAAAVSLFGTIPSAAFAQAAQTAPAQTAPAQTAPAQTAPAQTALAQLSLQVPATEVLLDLVVRDRHNRPVFDLQPTQISITDNDVPVALKSLRLVKGNQQQEPLITLLFDRPGIQSRQKDQDNSELDGPVSSAGKMSAKLRDAAAKLLNGFPAQGFQFAVMDIWGRLQLQQEYTGDRKALMGAISAAVQPGQYGTGSASNAVEEKLALVAKTGQDAAGVAAGAQERALARPMYAALTTSSRIPKDQHLSPALACLMALVEAQQSLPPGRKAIVYFTSISDTSPNATGKTSRDSRAKAALQSIIGAANRAGVNIYVVRVNEQDASKELASILEGYATLSIASQDIQQSAPTASNPSGVSSLQVARAGQFGDKSAFRMIGSKQTGATSADDDLSVLARSTGGDSINAAENFSTPVKDLVQDLTTYYEATYVPPAGDEDGSFHATMVMPLRSGLKLRTRTGYLALPPNAGITDPPQPFELPLMALLKAAELPAEVNYRAAVLRMGHGQEGSVNLLAVEAPLADLEVRKDTSTHLASIHVSILAEVKDGSGAVIERFSEDIARRWAAGNGADAAPGSNPSIAFDRPFFAPPGSYILETAIIDRNSGKAAAGRQPFEVAAPIALPELSQVVLVRGIEAAEDPDNSDNPDNNSNAADPLLYGDRRVSPNLYGQLPAGSHKVSVFFLAHTDPKSHEPATVKLEVLQNGVALGGKALTSTLKAGDEFHPVMNNFSITSAGGGSYQIKAVLTQDGKSTETIGDFTLTADGEGAAPDAKTEAKTDARAEANEAPLLADPPKLGRTDSPAQPTERPPAEELDRIMADARQNALDYREKLPNLICRQITSREEDSGGNGNWKHKDTLVEMLTYANQEERRTRVGAVENGAKKGEHDAIDMGLTSAGEFGEALGGVFSPESKAEFTWKESTTLRGETVEVFDYRIARAHSSFSLKVGSGFATAGYHGRIYIDRSTHGVLSITMNSDEMPKNFPLRKAAVRVDYDYVAINDHDYLLPVSAEVVIGKGRQSLERNDLEFSNFRRFGSTMRLVESPPDTKTN